MEARCKNKVSKSTRVLFFLTLTITKPRLHKTHKTNFPRGSKTETQSSRFLLNSIFFREFSIIFSLCQNSIRKSLWNGNFFLFDSRDSTEIFPPKKLRCKFFEGIPFWLHKILLSELLKIVKKLPKRQFSFEAGAECEDYLRADWPWGMSRYWNHRGGSFAKFMDLVSIPSRFKDEYSK